LRCWAAKPPARTGRLSRPAPLSPPGRHLRGVGLGRGQILPRLRFRRLGRVDLRLGGGDLGRDELFRLKMIFSAKLARMTVSRRERFWWTASSFLPSRRRLSASSRRRLCNGEQLGRGVAVGQLPAGLGAQRSISSMSAMILRLSSSETGDTKPSPRRTAGSPRPASSRSRRALSWASRSEIDSA